MDAPVLNRPLWLDGASTDFPRLSGTVDVDVAVVGAGITGATTAHLLKQAGRTVALIESSRVGYGATGYTTAKLTVGHNLVYRDLVDSFGEETAAGTRARTRRRSSAWRASSTSTRSTATSSARELRLHRGLTQPCASSSARPTRPGAPASPRS